MGNKVAKFNYGDRFKTKKGKTITIIGVFKDKENNIMYFLDKLKDEVSEQDLMKLEKIK